MLVSSGNVSGDGVSDGTRVYFLEGNRIKSIPVGGGSPSTLIDIPAGSLSSRGLEVDDAFIYWTDTSGGAGAGRIWRMPKQ